MVHKINHTLHPIQPTDQSSTTEVKETDKSFSHFLKDAIEGVNHQQKESDHKTELLIAGNDIDLHEVMIAAQKASITLETTVQIQKKMLDAYNEVMRIQI